MANKLHTQAVDNKLSRRHFRLKATVIFSIHFPHIVLPICVCVADYHYCKLRANRTLQFILVTHSSPLHLHTCVNVSANDPLVDRCVLEFGQPCPV